MKRNTRVRFLTEAAMIAAGYTVLTLIVDGQEEPVTVVGCIPCAAHKASMGR